MEALEDVEAAEAADDSCAMGVTTTAMVVCTNVRTVALGVMERRASTARSWSCQKLAPIQYEWIVHSFSKRNGMLLAGSAKITSTLDLVGKVSGVRSSVGR